VGFRLLLFKLLGSVRLLLLLVGGFWCFGGERPVFLFKRDCYFEEHFGGYSNGKSLVILCCQ
jgi:hypothetical protein